MEHQLQGSGTSISINYIISGYVATMITYYLYHIFLLFIYGGNLVRHFVFFFLVSNRSYSIRWHCSYSSCIFFFFSGLLFVLFFYIYCYTDTTNFIIFSQLLRCQFLISQNKIIKYETVTNHNWK